MNRTIRVLLVAGLAVACMGLATNTSDIEVSEELLEAILGQFMYGGGEYSGGHAFDYRGQFIAFGAGSLIAAANPSGSLDRHKEWPNLADLAEANPPYEDLVKPDSLAGTFAEAVEATGWGFTFLRVDLKELESDVSVLDSRVAVLEARPRQTSSTSCNCDYLVADLNRYRDYINGLNNRVNDLIGDVNRLQNALISAGIYY